MKTAFWGLFVTMILGYYDGFCQKPNLPIDEKTGKTVYTEVVTIENVTADKIHARAVNWFKTYFTNSGSVIKENDPATNKINGQHGIYIYNEVDGKKNKEGLVKYRISVMSKDGRYKYEVHDIFKLESPKIYIEEYLDESAVNKEVQFGYARQVDTAIKELVTDLKESMQQPLASEEEEEW